MQSAKLNNALHDAKLHYSKSCILSGKKSAILHHALHHSLHFFLKMQSTGVNIVRLTSNFCQNLIILPKLFNNISGYDVKSHRKMSTVRLVSEQIVIIYVI